MPVCELFFAYSRNQWSLSYQILTCCKESAKGEAYSSKIDFEILPYLTGAINSSMMMLTVAKVTERTRRGQTARWAYF